MLAGLPAVHKMTGIERLRVNIRARQTPDTAHLGVGGSRAKSADILHALVQLGLEPRDPAGGAADSAGGGSAEGGGEGGGGAMEMSTVDEDGERILEEEDAEDPDLELDGEEDEEKEEEEEAMEAAVECTVGARVGKRIRRAPTRPAIDP